MTYSLTVRGKSIAAALDSLAARFDSEVVAREPGHRHDKATALAVAKLHAELLRPITQDDHVVICLNGSLSWRDVGDDAASKFTSASTGVTALLVAAASDTNGMPVAE